LEILYLTPEIITKSELVIHKNDLTGQRLVQNSSLETSFLALGAAQARTLRFAERSWLY
jgi:hypothetical protein